MMATRMQLPTGVGAEDNSSAPYGHPQGEGAARSGEAMHFPGILPLWTTDPVWEDTIASLVHFPPVLPARELRAAG